MREPRSPLSAQPALRIILVRRTATSSDTLSARSVRDAADVVPLVRQRA
jgi:hypothetical protein